MTNFYRSDNGITPCWGWVSGSGLDPGVDVILVVIDLSGRFTEQTIRVTDATGSATPKLNLPCQVPRLGVFATVGSVESITASGWPRVAAIIWSRSGV